MVSIALALAIIVGVLVYIFYKAIFMGAKYDREDFIFVLIGLIIAFVLIKERE